MEREWEGMQLTVIIGDPIKIINRVINAIKNINHSTALILCRI